MELTNSKKQKLLETLSEIQQCKGVIPIKLLQYSAGILGWVTSAIPVARPWLAMIWAAITQKQHPVLQQTRHRKGLVFVKQIYNAVSWISALVTHGSGTVQLCKLYRWRPHSPAVLVQTDASPYGLGGTLTIGGSFVAYFADKISDIDCQRFGSTVGDPAFQSEYELLAVLVAIRVFSTLFLAGGEVAQVTIRTDNMAVVHAALRYRSGSPVMVQLTAELCLELESLQLSHVLAQHTPGTMNYVADKLSRLSLDGYTIPEALLGCKQCAVPPRDDSFYRACWPKQGRVW